MSDEKHIKEMADKIRLLRKTATELKQMSGGIQTIDRNLDRILASVKMLELNVSDVAELKN
jgi:archaellum component FlaC